MWRATAAPTGAGSERGRFSEETPARHGAEELCPARPATKTVVARVARAVAPAPSKGEAPTRSHSGGNCASKFPGGRAPGQGAAATAQRHSERQQKMSVPRHASRAWDTGGSLKMGATAALRKTLTSHTRVFLVSHLACTQL